MTWGQITNQVKLWASPSVVANTIIDDNVGAWQQSRRDQITRRRNWWFMKTTASQTVTKEAGRSYTLPSDFKDDIAFWLQFDTPGSFHVLTSKGVEYALATYGPDDEGEPEIYTLGSNFFSLWPKPEISAADGGYLLKLYYYAWPKIYSGTSDSDQISLQYPDLYIFSLTADAFNASQEYERAMYWEKKLEALLADLEIEHVLRELASPQPWEVHRGHPGIPTDAGGWRFR